MLRCARLSLVLGLGVASAALAQEPAELRQERADFAAWLKDAPNSPYKAVALQPVGNGVTLGPATADVPLENADSARLTVQRGVAILEGRAGRTTVGRNRLTAFGEYSLLVTGPMNRAVVAVFSPRARGTAPRYFEFSGEHIHTVALRENDHPRPVRILSLDGVEVQAADVGMVEFPSGGSTARLHVYRVPDPTGEEPELMSYFRDATNGKLTYPAGRFVSLTPVGGGRYRLDFNRSRNPFCAYSTAYPCPAPWPGNELGTPIRAGEQYVSPPEHP